MNLLTLETSIQLLCLAILSILFLQSGFNKVFDYKGNLQWLRTHFAKSPLSRSVGILFPILTTIEVAAGLFCAVGLVVLVMNGDTSIGLMGAQLAALSIVVLFFGQRLAEDYEGAASLMPYFIVCLITIYALG